MVVAAIVLFIAALVLFIMGGVAAAHLLFWIAIACLVVALVLGLVYRSGRGPRTPV